MLEGLTPPKKFTGTCKVGEIAKTLSDKDRDIFLSAASNAQDWPVKTLSKSLLELGIQISDSPIYNHRAKTCACYRD